MPAPPPPTPGVDSGPETKKRKIENALAPMTSADRLSSGGQQLERCWLCALFVDSTFYVVRVFFRFRLPCFHAVRGSLSHFDLFPQTATSLSLECPFLSVL
jgi:hypothetical protein